MPAAASTRSDYCESVCASTEENDVGLGRVDLIGALPNSIPEEGENLVNAEADAADKDEFFEGFDGASVSNGEFSPASTKDDGHKALEGDEAARIPLQPMLCFPKVTINSEEPLFDHLGLQTMKYDFTFYDSEDSNGNQSCIFLTSTVIAYFRLLKRYTTDLPPKR